MTTTIQNTYNIHPAFELNHQHRIDSLGIDVLVCRHKATQAVHYHLACDNDENALLIGFATQPMTSRGEAHILEHTVLCGSQKYPVRDPFFSMVKRSLNTFMNAMTASDWTVYPFASQNKNDFFNLLSVYMDAVFFPNIDALDFAQEGIRIELDDEDKAHYHGIVFNEMKGAMSGEIDQLYYALTPHLFPTTTYHYNSGGDPKDIPKLTHADLVAFHRTHYHPSNAIIMSFGDIDIHQIQQKLHDDALVRFDDQEYPKLGKKFVSMTETRLEKPVQVFDTYTSDEDGDKLSHQVLAWLLPSIIDPKQRLALRLMEGVLIEHAGSPLRAYLDSHALGSSTSPLLGLDDSHYEMVFYAGLRGCAKDDADAIEQGILSLLADIASSPIDPSTIETILHQIELDQRHIGGDGTPYGLTLMLEGFSTALHGGDPMDVWQIDEHLAWLKAQSAQDGWIGSLITTHLLNNPHRVRLTLSPDIHKASQLVKDEQDILAQISQNLSDEDKKQIREQMYALNLRQATIDDVNVLPKVGLSDIPSDIAFTHGQTLPITIEGTTRTLYQYHASTNGLYYYQVIIDLQDKDTIINSPLLPIYLSLLSEVGTDEHDARTFQEVQASCSSGITARISQRTDPTNKDLMSSFLVMATRALNDKTQAIDVLSQVMQRTRFDEIDRISELLEQRQSSWRSRLSGQGHAYAMQTASAGMNRLSAIEYAYAGLPALNALRDFLKHTKDNPNLWQDLSDNLSVLHQEIMNLPKDVILVSQPQVADDLRQIISDKLGSPTPTTIPANPLADFEHLRPLLTQPNANRAWLISSNVFFNASAYPAVTANHDDAPALTVLAVFLRNGYLHGTIREQGGAYGGGASFDSNASAFKFYSYRDPNCQATFEHFKRSIDWLLDNDHNEEQLEEAILGIMASMDKPGSPAGEAVKSCFATLHGKNQAWQQRYRQKLLNVRIDDLKRVARTYLKDQSHTDAVLAPIEQEATVRELGFEIHR